VDKITLDRETFKALASDTRLDILKALDERQKTVTELAKELELNKATVFEHLEKLASVKLIQKLEDERKWVYWQLTWTGRRLLHPEAVTLALVLSSAAATLLTTLVAAFLWVRSAVPLPANAAGTREGTSTTASDGAAQAPAPSGAAQPQTANSLAAPQHALVAPSATPGHDATLMWVWIALAVVTLALLAYAAWTWRRARQRRAAGA
jgi:DNA-binding transcriptional ArsR family regulator